MSLKSLSVRYIVDNIDIAVGFYTQHFGFRVVKQLGGDFALLERDNLRLFLSPPSGPGGGSQPMPDGRRPAPGGWNRIVVQTGDLKQQVSSLERDGVRFRNDVVTGPGGRQILAEDPCGNLVELFEPAAGAASQDS